MIAHDDDFLDSIAALALGVLPAAESEPLAKHVGSCADCRPLYARLRSAADLVGYEAEASEERFDEVSRFRLKSRILKGIRADLSAPGSGQVASNGKAATARPQRAWIAYAAAAAAIAIAALDTIQMSSLSHENERLANLANQQTSIAAKAGGQLRELDARVALLVAPGGTHYAIPGGQVVASASHIVIALRGMPAPPAGKAYQTWTLKRGAKLMTPGATFIPDAGGVAVVEIPVDASGIAAVAVSLEPRGGSSAPTSKPTFVRTLS